MTSTGKCQAVNRRGEPCQAYAVNGSRWCFWHDPERAHERKRARSRGGLARHGRTLAGGDPVSLRSVADVMGLLEVAAADVLGLERSVSRARALGYLAGVAVKLLEVGSLEERVTRLEELAQK